MKLSPQTRLATIELKAGADNQSDTIELSFSSEEPYDRGWGTEILGHKNTECDLGWMASGRAPLLVDHDASVDNQVGVIERAWIENGRGKAVARFGKSARAQDMLQRVKDGQLGNVSVGYRINDMLLVEEHEDKSVYRVTSWKPLEASLVTIPADASVGVGRSEHWENLEVNIHHKETITMTEQVKTVETPAPVNSEEVLKNERARIADISAIGRQFNMQDIADEAIKSGLSADKFRHNVLTRLGSDRDTVLQNMNSIGLTKKEVQNFSFMRAIRAIAFPRERQFQDQAAFELEVGRAAAEKSGQPAKGILVPSDVLCAPMRRDLNVGTGSQGGYAVATDLLAGSFIELLRAKSVVAEAGARMMTNLIGNVAVPKQTGAATGYWVSTEGGTPTESTQALGQLSLSPKTVGAFTDYTRQFMLQSSLDAEAFVRDDFAKVLALKIDLAALYGSGSSGEPQGVKLSLIHI